MIGEALVNSSLNHGKFLHGAGKGHITVGRKFPELPSPGNWRQHSYPTQKLYEVLPAYGGVYDVYISQNRFWGPRAVSRLASLSAMYSDLDYYKIPGLEGMHPLAAMDLAFEALQRARIPHPSLVVATGRGLDLVWTHHSVPRAALPKWNLCQYYIFEALRGLGGDPAAKDAARVLRLVGSLNSNTDTLVEAIYEDHGESIWDFGDLADEILPLTREELEERRVHRRESSEKRASKDTRDTRKASKGRDNAEKRFTPYTLALGRLSDLQRLLSLRELDKLPPGQRNNWMFAAGTSLAYLVEPQFLERELIQLGKDYASWSEAETRSGMHSVIRRAQDAGAGEKVVEWEGKQRDPRYWLTTRKIIEMLGITPEEEKEMKILISEETKRQRKRERKKQKRRVEGVIPRHEYLAKANEQRGIVQDLRRERMSYRKIGEVLGISRTKAWRLSADTKSK
jgi:hypothetical protein